MDTNVMIESKLSIKPSFSIVVPVYNTEKYLAKCLDSLLDQQGDFDFEVILIDDGSTDNSAEICAFYCNKSSVFHYFYQKNSGLGAARNEGLVKSSNDYLLFVDSDDYIAPHTLVTLAQEIIAKNSPDIIEFRLARVDQSMNVIYQSRYHPSPDFMSILSCKSDSSACTKAYKRQFFLNTKVLFPQNCLYEDVATLYKLYLCTSHIVAIDCLLYFYLLREDSITAKMTQNNIDDLFASAESTLLFFENKVKNDVLHLSALSKEEWALNEVKQGIQLRFITLAVHCLKELWANADLHNFIEPTIKRLQQFYSDISNVNLLKKVDLVLLQDYVGNVLFYQEKLLIRRKENELFSIEEIRSIENLELSKNAAKLSTFLLTLKKRYNKIALYGNGTIAQFSQALIGQNICQVYDVNSTDQYWQQGLKNVAVKDINDIESADFDVIFISVFGREKEIKHFLQQSIKLSDKQIITFNL